MKRTVLNVFLLLFGCVDIFVRLVEGCSIPTDIPGCLTGFTDFLSSIAGDVTGVQDKVDDISDLGDGITSTVSSLSSELIGIATLLQRNPLSFADPFDMELNSWKESLSICIDFMVSLTPIGNVLDPTLSTINSQLGFDASGVIDDALLTIIGKASLDYQHNIGFFCNNIDIISNVLNCIANEDLAILDGLNPGTTRRARRRGLNLEDASQSTFSNLESNTNLLVQCGIASHVSSYTDAEMVTVYKYLQFGVDLINDVISDTCDVIEDCSDPIGLIECFGGAVCFPMIQIGKLISSVLQIINNKADFHDSVLMTDHLNSLFINREIVVNNQKELGNSINNQFINYDNNIINNQFNQLTNQINDNFGNSNNNINNQFANSNNNINNKFEQTNDNINNKFNNQLTPNINNQFTQSTNNINQNFIISNNNINQKFTDSNNNINNKFDQITQFTDTQFTQSNQNINANFNTFNIFTDDQFTLSTHNINQKFNELTEYTDNEFNDSTTNVNNRFAETTDIAATKFHLYATWMDDKFDEMFHVLSIVETLIRTQDGKIPGFGKQDLKGIPKYPYENNQIPIPV